MARQPRIEFPGALYHVMVRGNQGQRIFRDDQDRSQYIGRLKNCKKAYSFRPYAFVLMVNHVHLLMETGWVPLSRIMQRLSSSYTQYFNRRHRLKGHLFQGRYRAILCDKDTYLLELSRYLHLNPVRVKAVSDPGKYRWSSYGAYLGKGREQDWVETKKVLAYFGRKEGKARRGYRRFVLEGIEQGYRGEYYEVIESRILGGREFVEEVKGRAGEKEKVLLKIKPEAFLKRVCGILGKKVREVVGSGKDRDRVRARELLSYLGRTYTELEVKSIAEVMKVDPTCVSRSVARVEARVGNDKKSKKSLDEMAKDLENVTHQA